MLKEGDEKMKLFKERLGIVLEALLLAAAMIVYIIGLYIWFGNLQYAFLVFALSALAGYIIGFAVIGYKWLFIEPFKKK